MLHGGDAVCTYAWQTWLEKEQQTSICKLHAASTGPSQLDTPHKYAA